MESLKNSEPTPETEKGIDLDELQGEAEKLVSLLKDRQPGLMTWNDFMRERLEALHSLASKALNKKDNG